MRRMELFEIHDHPLFPAFLRNLCTDALEALWSFSNSYKPILSRLNHALAEVQTCEVLDLCSGGGGPWLQLARDMEVVQNNSILVCLTDKYPNNEAFERARSQSKSKIRSDSRSISATEVPVDLSGFRTIFSSFHHFGPEDASHILANAVNCGKGIGIFETACRRPKTALAICFIPFLVWFVTPRSVLFAGHDYFGRMFSLSFHLCCASMAGCRACAPIRTRNLESCWERFPETLIGGNSEPKAVVLYQ